MFGFKCLVCQQCRLLSAKTRSEIKGILAANKGTDDKDLYFLTKKILRLSKHWRFL